MLGMERRDAAGRGVKRAVGERHGAAGGGGASAGVALSIGSFRRPRLDIGNAGG